MNSMYMCSPLGTSLPPFFVLPQYQHLAHLFLSSRRPHKGNFLFSPTLFAGSTQKVELSGLAIGGHSWDQAPIPKGPTGVAHDTDWGATSSAASMDHLQCLHYANTMFTPPVFKNKCSTGNYYVYHNFNDMGPARRMQANVQEYRIIYRGIYPTSCILTISIQCFGVHTINDHKHKKCV